MPNAPPLSYGTLSQRSPEYDEETWLTLDDFYKGGFALAKNARRYLTKLDSESAVRFDERTRAAGYINHLAHVIDKFAAAVFQGEFSVTEAADSDNPGTKGSKAPPVYADFYPNADGRRTALRTIAKCLLTTALRKGRALLALDLTDAPADLANLAQEEDVGANAPRCWEIPLEQLIDWKRDDKGGFEWAILNRTIRERESPAKSRALVTEEFKVWTLDESGKAAWTLYSVKYDPKEPPKPEDPIQVTDSGVTTFGRIPVLELRIAPGLWVGNKIGTLVKEHWQRRTTLVNSENKNLVVVPVVKLGPEMSAIGEALPSDAQQDPGRGNMAGQLARRGYMVLGKDDDLAFPAPDGACYEVVDQQLQGLKDDIYRIVDQMAESADNKASSMRRSGESKARDREAFEIVCAEYGETVRELVALAMDQFAKARGDDVVWQVNGLDDFSSEDREKVINEGLALDALPIPSETFKRIHKTDVALRLMSGADPSTKDQVRKEIAEAVKDEEKLRAITLDAKKDAIENPPPVVMPGQAPQPGKPGAQPPPKGKPAAPAGAKP
jgi:hypothetical protein